MNHAITHGDVLESLRGLPSDSFDGLLCDPPYGFRFMGKKWDYDVPSVDVWRECLRVLKPGAPLLSFGGARTFHRIATRIEDAGFQLRDVLMWLYGTGVPKSQNIGLAIDKSLGATREVVGTRILTGRAAMSSAEKGGTYGVQVGTGGSKEINVTAPATELAQAWDGYGTALKPAYEPVILARKPLEGTMADGVARWGCGGLALDACRIGVGDELLPAKITGQAQIGAFERGTMLRPERVGRWPANLLLDEDFAAALDASVARTKSGPSRFFYCGKVGTKEREAGCEALPRRSVAKMTETPEGSARGAGARNHHPTLKPISLTTWLASVIRPPAAYKDATLLVPYSGAGSEMIGALRAGWPLVFGIEGVADYVEIANARIREWTR